MPTFKVMLIVVVITIVAAIIVIEFKFTNFFARTIIIDQTVYYRTKHLYLFFCIL